MSHCIYCGHETGNEEHHFHGTVGKFCRYTRCGSDYQNFKYRLEKYLKSDDEVIKEFALRVQKAVFTDNEPVLNWNLQLISLRKLRNKMPLIKPLKPYADKNS